MCKIELGQGVSISKYRGTTRYRYQIEVSTDDWMVHFQHYSWLPGLIHPLTFLYSDSNLKKNTVSSFSSQVQTNLQCEYRVSSIEHNSSIVRYQINDGINPAPVSNSAQNCMYFSGEYFWNNDFVFLLSDKPAIELLPFNPYHILEGHDMVLTCRIHANPPVMAANVFWSVDGQTDGIVGESTLHTQHNVHSSRIYERGLRSACQ